MNLPDAWINYPELLGIAHKPTGLVFLISLLKKDEKLSNILERFYRYKRKNVK